MLAAVAARLPKAAHVTASRRSRESLSGGYRLFALGESLGRRSRPRPAHKVPGAPPVSARRSRASIRGCASRPMDA